MAHCILPTKPNGGTSEDSVRQSDDPSLLWSTLTRHRWAGERLVHLTNSRRFTSWCFLGSDRDDHGSESSQPTSALSSHCATVERAARSVPSGEPGGAVSSDEWVEWGTRAAAKCQTGLIHCSPRTLLITGRVHLQSLLLRYTDAWGAWHVGSRPGQGVVAWILFVFGVCEGLASVADESGRWVKTSGCRWWCWW